MKLPSELESVTVYRTGAVCTRVARLPGPGEGAPQVWVTGLPLACVATSLRARALDDGVLVHGVRAGFDVELGADSDLDAHTRALDAAREQTARLQLELDRLERELGELGGLLPRFREPPRREPPRTAPLPAMLALADFVAARTAAVQARRRALAIELEDAREHERTCAARLAEASTARRGERAKVTRAAIVTLSAWPAGACAIAIEYQVPGARWVPTYQLALDEGGGGRLAMRASIAQRTGEDWSAVALALSTASLHRRTAVPELKSLRVGRAQPPPARAGWREVPPGLDGLFADFDAAHASLVPVRTIAVPPPAARSAPLPPMAPPPPPSMPPPRAPMPVAMPMSASFGAPAAGGMPMPSAPPAPQRLAARTAIARHEAPAEQAMAEAAMDDELAASTGTAFTLDHRGPAGPSADLLDYDALQMHGPAGPGRGRLAPAPAAAVIFATTVSVHVDVVLAALAKAEHLAGAVAQLPPPRDCIAPDAQARFDYSFAAAAPADVPSTGAWTNVAVTTCAVELVPRYLCVPAVESAVYRTLELVNRSPHALLPGPVDVSRGGQFLLTTTLPATGPQARGRRIGLGVEEAIKVARNTRFEETTGGLFGGQAVLPHELDIEIDNRLGVEIDLEVRERVPVVEPGEKDLKVEEAEARPPWQAVDEPEDGVLVHGLRRWRVRVPARSKQTLQAKYTIRMPADRMLTGGNRRS